MGTGGSRYVVGRPGWRQKCEHTLMLDSCGRRVRFLAVVM